MTMTPEELKTKWKRDMAELRRHWRAWVTLMRPFFEESNRRCWAFGVGAVKGEKGRAEALQANAPGNTDTAGEAQAFEMGCVAGPILRSYLFRLALDAISGAHMAGWLREILRAMIEALLSRPPEK